MTAAIECCGLCVGYGEKAVLSGVDLAIAKGEVIALLGPNGSGKSSLLRTLSGLIPRQSGGILLLGDDLDQLNTREIARRIAFVPQEEAWFFDFTVEEVVAMGRLPISNGFFDTVEDHEAAERAMRAAGCLTLRSRPMTGLSGGERQRVLIARAIAQDCPIIFLDEPTAHLDPQFQISTASLVRHFAQEGKTVVIAVHDLAIAAAMASKAVLVSAGRAAAPAPMEGVLDSDELETAYETKFDRLRTPDGRLVVVPKPTCGPSNTTGS